MNFRDPIFWAVLIGWILSVTLHEFAHGVVGYWGGDYTIRERGGLTLNPLHYVDPVMSLLLPLVFMLMGGIPLPGGATYVRRDLLRSRLWESAMSAAGPLMNFLLFAACVAPFHPAFGWAKAGTFGVEPGPIQIFLAATAVLQFFSILFNLVPIPPLDGFRMIEPWLDARTQSLSRGSGGMGFLIGFFLLLRFTPHLLDRLFLAMVKVLSLAGYDPISERLIATGYNSAMVGRP